MELGNSLIIKGTVERRGPPASFLNRYCASIISSSSWLSRGVFLSQRGQAGSTEYHVLCGQRAGTRNHYLPSSLGWMWVSCHHCLTVRRHVSRFCLMVLLLSEPLGFVVKQTCFLSNLTYRSRPYCFLLTIPLWD